MPLTEEEKGKNYETSLNNKPERAAIPARRLSLPQRDTGQRERLLRQALEVAPRYQPRLLRWRSERRFHERGRDVWNARSHYVGADRERRVRCARSVPRASVVLINL